jgi:uncharacterized OsmC-like protein
MLEAKTDAGPSSDRPATAVMEDGLRSRVEGGDGWVVATDMPAAVGGSASAPSPAWLLRAAWASCAATAIAMRAAELGITLIILEVSAESETDMRGLLAAGDGVPPGPQRARLRVRIASDDQDPSRLRELVEWADQHSPVGDALRRTIPLELELVGE